MDAFLLSQSSYCQLSGVPIAGKTRRFSLDRIRIRPQRATLVPVTCAACRKLGNAVPQTFHPAKPLQNKKKKGLSQLAEQPSIRAAFSAAKAGSETAADNKCLATSNVTRRQSLARVAALMLASALADSECSRARADTPYSQTQGKQTVVGLLKG